ncbi:MAG: hypothetical protein IPP72_09910 [Chitinophagaceae bacterium]|nr:hypothetical protein [Chitinophagaceae bacterium]
MKQPLLISLFLIGCLVTLPGCVSKYNTSGVVDAPVVSSDSKYLIVLIAESEAFTHQENGGYRKTNYSSSYWLKQYEVATGKLLKKKKLISASEKTNTTATCYGSHDNKIWLYLNGLQAYDINTLEEVMNEEKMAEANSMNKNIFPYEERLINPSVANGYIDFTASTGEQFRIHLKNFKIINKRNAEVTAENAEKRINRLFNSDGDYGIRCDTFSNKMFALAKDSTAAINYGLSNQHLNEVAYRMRLFKADFSIRQLGNHNSFDYTNIVQQGNTTYLNPCFAKDFYSGNAIHLSQPAGYLIIHQDVLGSNSKAILTRVDASNKKIWETATGISTKIAHCIVSGKYCIISSNVSYMFSPHIGKDALCILDTDTGNITSPKLKE